MRSGHINCHIFEHCIIMEGGARELRNYKTIPNEAFPVKIQEKVILLKIDQEENITVRSHRKLLRTKRIRSRIYLFIPER